VAVRTVVALALVASFAFAGDPPKGAADKDAKDKVDAIKGAKDDVAKKKAIADAGKCPHASVAAVLGSVVIDTTAAATGLRIDAADALGEMKGLAEAAKALANGVSVNEKNGDVLKAIFRAMGKVGRAEAVPSLKDFASKQIPFKNAKAPSDLVVASIDALVEIKSKASVEALLVLHNCYANCDIGDLKVNGLVFEKIQAGLRTLLPGLPKNLGGEEWIVWWNKNKETFNDDLTPKK